MASIREKIAVWLRKANSSERGDILILALIVMVLVSLLIGPLLSHMSTGMKNSKEVYTARTAEQYAADAGVTRAMWYIKYQSEDVPESFSINNINNKTVFVNISKVTNEDESDTYSISSRAGSTTIDAQINTTAAIPEVPPTPPEDSVGLFANGISALNGDITFNAGNASITGDAFVTGGKVAFPTSGSNTISGDVYASGGISGKGTVNGDQIIVNQGSTVGLQVSHPNATPDYDTKNFIRPDQQIDDLRQGIHDLTYNIYSPSTGGTLLASPIKNKGSSGSPYHYLDQQYYTTGNLSFTNSNYVVFDHELYVTGNMSIAGDAHLTFSGPVNITGQLIMTGGGGSVTFNDSLTAGSVNFTNGMTLNLNNNLKILGDFTAGSGGAMGLGGTTYVGGNLSVSGNRQITASDAIYVAGNLSLQNGGYIINSTTAPNSHNKVIIVGGNITMSGGTDLGNANQIPLIVDLNTSATITISNGADVWAAIYAPDANVLLQGNAQVKGALVARSITLGSGSGSPGITFLATLLDRTDLEPYKSDPGSPGDPGVPGSPAGVNLTTWDIR